MNHITFSILMLIFTTTSFLAFAKDSAKGFQSGNFSTNSLNSGVNLIKKDRVKKSEISLDFGIAFPIGDFKNQATSSSGVDGAGSGAFMSLGYAYSFTDRISALVSLNSISMAANPETIKVGSNTIYKSGWSMAAFLVGAKYSYPLGKISIEPSLKLGTSVNSSGNMEMSQDSSYVSLTEYPSNTSLAYQFGLDAVYSLSERWGIKLSSSYFGSEYEYNAKTKNIQVLNMGIGVNFKF